MYLSLLFDQSDRLVAAAPACDQQPLGNGYWRNVHPQPLDLKNLQIAVVDVKNEDLVQMLLSLADDSAILEKCRVAFDAYEDSQSPHAPVRRSRAA